MVSSSPSRNDTGRPALPSGHRTILQGLVATASVQIDAQVNDFSVRLVAALLDAAQARTDAKEANACFAAGSLLKNNAYPFYHLASIAVRKGFQQAVDDLDVLGLQCMSPLAELTLVPFAEMENRLVLERAARPLEQAHAALLSTVDQHVALLADRTDPTPADNPFRPAVLLAAFDYAWREFTPDRDLHGLMLQMMQDGVVPDVRPMLEALDRACVDAGIRPHPTAHRPIRKTRASHTPASAATVDPVLMAQLRRMLHTPALPAATGATSLSASASAPAISPALSAYLSKLQARTRRQSVPSAGNGFDDGTAYDIAAGTPTTRPAGLPDSAANGVGAPQPSLRELQQQLPRDALTRADETAIDVMTRIFDAVIADPNIPAEMKELIGYLQIPVLKAALIDKEFFFEDAHPARRLISLMTRSSVGWDRSRGRADPLYRAIARNVDRIQAFDVELALFADVASDLEAFLAEEEDQAEVQLAVPITQALAQEKIRESTRAATTDVAQRIATGEVAPFIETFLQDRWVPVLAMAYNVREQKPQILASAIRTMDELVWSVRPKFTAQERHALVEKLPPLLTSLNKWMSIMKWNDTDRLQFFADLAECHASIVRAPLELSPQRQLEIAVEAARLAAERRAQKHAAVAVAPVSDSFVEQVAALERGAWFEFVQADASVRRVKLAWVSPLRTLYIFTTVHREEAFSLSADTLTQNFRQQKVRIVNADGFVDRALADMLQQSPLPVLAWSHDSVASA